MFCTIKNGIKATLSERMCEIIKNDIIKKQADYILSDKGLLKKLELYGTAHIIGSYRMDLMAWNDLDIDIENDNMSLDRLYELTDYVLKQFKPIWYEAKQEVNKYGKTVWFLGFECYIFNELWNVDLWFFDKETIRNSKDYCDNILKTVQNNSNLKSAIIDIKTELINRNLYAFDKYTSIDVYNAVLEKGITDINDFLMKIHV